MMKKIKLILLFSLIAFSAAFPSSRKVLVELFTNSHCPLCPPAHATLAAYSSQSNIVSIYYHMLFPYPDDPLSQANKTEPDARYKYYGSSDSTPITFFDGANQATSYSQWNASLDNRVQVSSPVEITLSGTRKASSIMINASLKGTGTLAQSGLIIHFVIVENGLPAGRNGVNPQNNVMRKMITGTSGQALSLSTGESKTVSEPAELSSDWNANNCGVVVFIQNNTTKEVLQAEYISINSLTNVTAVKNNNLIPGEYGLNQNYPNPFNPTTKISWELPSDNHVVLKVFNVLGQQVAEPVNEYEHAGKFERTFDAGKLSSGIYFYRIEMTDGLKTNFLATRKFVLIK